MSFSATYVGQARNVGHVLAQPDNPQFVHGQKLGQLTREYLAAVAELADDDKIVTVKTNGHAGGGLASVTLELTTAWAVAAPPERENVYAHPAEDAYTSPQ